MISRSMMSRSRNLPRAQRVPEATRAMRQETRIADTIWRDFEKSCIKAYGRDSGAWVFAGMMRGEHDFRFGCTTLLGVEPLDWQVSVWDALLDHRYVVVRGSNAIGKTTGYALFDMMAGFYRMNATPDWGASQYRMLALAPQEPQALEAKQKIDLILKDRSREQMFRIKGGYDYRPCLLTPFFRAEKHDGGQHEGYSINDGSSILTFRSTAFKAKGSDGTDPTFVTWDELRHESNFTHVLNAILMPRFLRVPFGRLLMFFTPLEASVELIAAFNRGVSGLASDVDWWSLALDLATDNPNISADTIARAHRNIDKRYLPMVTGGKPIQPAKAKFNQASVEACFTGTTEPDWLTDLLGCRARVIARCPKCKAKEQHIIGDGDRMRHPLAGFLDPASSARYDATVATVWDLEPPTFPRVWGEVVYLEELPPGTVIQRVGIHVALMSLLIHGPVGYDQNSALGHNVKDEIAEFYDRDELLGERAREFLEADLRAALERADLAEEAEIVPYDRNSKREKDEDLDFFGGLMDLRKWESPFQLTAKSQITNYERDDKSISQDFVMVQVGAAWVGRWYMLDLEAEKAKKARVKRRAEEVQDDAYAGVGFSEDVYFTLPEGVGELAIGGDFR